MNMKNKVTGEFDIKFINGLMSQIATYKAKVAAANKILNEFPNQISVVILKGELTMPFSPADEVAIWIDRLREALKDSPVESELAERGGNKQ
jgi:hypothetical protein